MIEVKGHNGQVQFDGQLVTIKRHGFVARSTVGKGEKRIPIGSINGLQWKPAGSLVNGFVQFETSGGGGTRSRSGRQTTDAVHDENSVIFTKRQMPEFEQLRDAVQRALINAQGQPFGGRPYGNMSVADELTKLVGLRQQGLLTDQEFQAQKARLLAS